MAEAEDLKSSQCGFDPHSGHVIHPPIHTPTGLSHLDSIHFNGQVVIVIGAASGIEEVEWNDFQKTVEVQKYWHGSR